jgi:hypothetical protein
VYFQTVVWLVHLPPPFSLSPLLLFCPLSLLTFPLACTFLSMLTFSVYYHFTYNMCCLFFCFPPLSCEGRYFCLLFITSTNLALNKYLLSEWFLMNSIKYLRSVKQVTFKI